MKKNPFDIKYRPQIESGEYRVVTREERPVEIKIWDLKGEFPVVGVYYDEKNNRDTAVQVTANGRCSIKPDDYYCDDFFIITDKSDGLEFKQGGWYLCTKTHMFFKKGEIYECHRDGTIDDGCGRAYIGESGFNDKYFRPFPAEFRKQLEIMVEYAVNGAKSGVNIVSIFANRIFDCAKLEIIKNLPIWEKSEKLIEGALLDRGTLYIPHYRIELSDLEKLPKEE